MSKKGINKTHGMSRTPEHRAWESMKARCYNKNNVRYMDYGNRGITVCESWVHCFETFLEDMGKKPKGKYSLDRIDNSNGYSPENCRWADDYEQANNTRKNRVISCNGLTLTMSQWARKMGFKKAAVIHNRLIRGWTEEQAVTVKLGTYLTKEQKCKK